MLWAFLIFIALLSLLPNLHLYPFKNEESLRHVVAFEMWHRGDFLQPTLLGELYYNKPPLFNWLIVLSAQFFGWGELAGRVVSLTFLVLTTLLTGAFSHLLFRRLELSLLSSLLFITFGNVLFFYGYLAEIDMSLTFFVLLGVLCLYVWWQGDGWLMAVASGLVFGLSGLLKGFPAYAFMALSLLAIAFHSRKLSPLLSKQAFGTYSISVLIPFLWLISTPEPLVYFSTLWRETFSRIEGDFSRLEHMLTYPLVNLKDLLPWSLLFFGALYTIRRSLQFPTQVSLLFLMFFFNYLPYWVSDSAGRYILPLYPLLAILFAYYIHGAIQHSGFRRLVVGTALFVIFLRFLYGLFYFPYQEKNSRKQIAMQMVELMGSGSSVACECPQDRAVCLYVGILTGKPLFRLKQSPEARYVITCGASYGSPLKEYFFKGRTFRLEELKALRPSSV